MQQLSLAVDSGGTSVRAILYNEAFLPVRRILVGSMRSNTTSEEQIKQNLKQLEQALFMGERPVLSRFSGTAFEALSCLIYSRCTVNTTLLSDEGLLGLRAAEIFGNGMLAVSGTGSKIYAQVNGIRSSLGGYGAILSDEGSGYWIGRLGFDVAIKSCEGRGRKTLLEKMICEKLNVTDLRNGIRSIYSMENVSPAAFVASCAELVSDAAYRGDESALYIVRKAGHSMGEQACALARMEQIPNSVPLTVSGSVWKGHPEIISEFMRVVKEKMPERKVVLPKFEPIIGAIIDHYYEVHGKFDDSDRKKFALAYPDYIYHIKYAPY